MRGDTTLSTESGGARLPILCSRTCCSFVGRTSGHSNIAVGSRCGALSHCGLGAGPSILSPAASQSTAGSGEVRFSAAHHGRSGVDRSPGWDERPLVSEREMPRSFRSDDWSSRRDKERTGQAADWQAANASRPKQVRRDQTADPQGQHSAPGEARPGQRTGRATARTRRLPGHSWLVAPIRRTVDWRP
jgi:hypothetical protein